MILVDTSVWIDYFNGQDTPQASVLDTALQNQTVVMGDLILLEILQGFRSDKDYLTAKEHLTALPIHNMLTPDLALKSVDYYRALRKKGLTVRKTADVIIATFCIEHGIPLLFSDKDFLPFTKHSKLRSAAKLK